MLHRNSITQVPICKVDKQDDQKFCPIGINGAMMIWDFKTLESSTQGLQLIWSWVNLYDLAWQTTTDCSSVCNLQDGEESQPQGNTKNAYADIIWVLFEYNWWKCWIFKQSFKVFNLFFVRLVFGCFIPF